MMTPNRTEWQIRCAFNAYCKRVLEHAATDIHRKRKRQRLKEITFSDLTLYETHQLYSMDDDVESDTEDFHFGGKRITFELLAKALEDLSEEKRYLLFLYYYYQLSDEAISQKLNVPRRTIHYRRTRALERLKRFLEVHANEWDE